MNRMKFSELLKMNLSEVLKELKESRKSLMAIRMSRYSPESNSTASGVHLLRKARKEIAMCMTAISILRKK